MALPARRHERVEEFPAEPPMLGSSLLLLGLIIARLLFYDHLVALLPSRGSLPT